MVNIAVFAAFAFLIWRVLLSNPAFKPLCAIWQLDISRYGWQKRQDRGKKWQESGKVGGKNGKVLMVFGRLHAASPLVARGCGRRVWRDMRLFKVLAARGGAVVVELNYRERDEVSRV